MTPEQLINGNKLIAEFMGYDLYNGNFIHMDSETPIGNMFLQKEAKYHSSWDWIMPVVEKIHINRNVKEVSIIPGRTRIWMQGRKPNTYIQSPCLLENNSITECWLAVIEFINWYNSNK